MEGKEHTGDIEGVYFLLIYGKAKLILILSLFPTFPWLEDSGGDFRSSSQVVTCLPHDEGFTLSLIMLSVKQGSSVTEQYVELTSNDFLSFSSNSKSTFSAMCINMRSLVNSTNFAKLEAFVCNLSSKPDTICITET